MSVLPVLLATCLLCGWSVRGYEEEYQVNYDYSYDNEIAEQERQVVPTAAPCQTPDLTRWDKVFIMLEDSAMRQNMLLHSLDEAVAGELRAMRGELRRVAKGNGASCAATADAVGNRLATQVEAKVRRAVERAVDERAARQDVALQQLLEASRSQDVRLGKVESACLGGAGPGGAGGAGPGAKGFKRQDVMSDSGESGAPEEALVAMAADLQRIQAQLELSQRRATQTFLPSGCETALLFPLRSRRIYAAMSPDSAAPLRSLTVCLWAKPTEALERTVLFSYGTRQNPQEAQLLLSRGAALFTVGGEAHLVEAQGAARDGHWGHYCGAWSSEQGLAALWVDGQQAASSAGVAEGHVLPDGAVMQLGQERRGSRFETSFDPKLAFAGKMTGVNVWDRVLGAEEIAELARPDGPSCGGRGNVIGWGVSEIVPHGGAQYIN
ncbi:hypothetical protein AAFF_G00237110 [Aldrovandia affinis]|uniref:Pentraxin (PTX) domain-containing protein n=1 Tax=Aldrovandia affinis TaxID=143900 RepID=A0AAD7RED5_9TELE|nr:hypothetical protein AAFF_G00237110 [Aldrovandia affinis]